ncbi:MAG: glycosyltransferase family 4 protein [Gemmatimonadales bacterium]
MRALIVSGLYADSQHRGKLRALAGLGVELGVAIPNGSVGLDAGVRLLPIPASGDAADAATLRWDAGALRRTLSDFRPALVQIEEEPASPAGYASGSACRRLGIPYVVFSWESLSRRRGLLEARRWRRTRDGAAALLAGNRHALALLRTGARTMPGAVLPQTGLTPKESPPRLGPRGNLSIGFVGRLVPERGGEMLLRACGQLLGSWSLTVVGTGPEQESLEELAQRLGLASRIRWMGGLPRADLEPLWESFDVLVLPSRETPAWVERHSPILLDAMMLGVAPIVTPAGALPELVGDAGIVVEDVDGLLLALQELVADPEKCRVLGQQARQRTLDSYVETALARRTLDFWLDILARPSPAVRAEISGTA